MSFLPGYMATITVNGVAYNPTTESATVNHVSEIMDKTKLGQRRRTKLKGLQDANFSLGLHMDTDTMAAMVVAEASIDPVPVVVRPGALGTFDAGQWAGDGLVSNLSTEATADDEWNVSMDIEMTGDFEYTQPI